MHGLNILGRIFVSRPVYCTVRVVTYVMRSDHRAIVACTEQPSHVPKTTTVRTFRAVSAGQHAQFLRHMSVGSTTAMTAQILTHTRLFYDLAIFKPFVHKLLENYPLCSYNLYLQSSRFKMLSLQHYLTRYSSTKERS